jgi:hypothetical protein
MLAVSFSNYAAYSAKAAVPEQAASIPTYQWQFLSASEKTIGGNSQTSAVDLSSAKIVSLYESILDTDKQTLVNILADTGTEVVFRAHFLVAPSSASIVDLSDLRDRIAYVKARLPWVHFMGGVDAYGYCGGLPSNASELLYVLPNGTLPGEYPGCYELDIAKPAARKVVLNMAYTLIDAGFDSLFFDCLDCLAGTFNLPTNTYVEAWREISSGVKDYAQAKYGKEIQVCVNTSWESEIWPYQDFISEGLTASGAEMIKNQRIRIDWDGIKANVKRIYGHLLPIMFFLDWGSAKSPMVALASLPREDQVRVITLLHDATLQQSVLFVYPLHGGFYQIAPQPWKKYDAIEQGTYDAIKQLSSSISPITTNHAWPTVREVEGNLSQALDADLAGENASNLLAEANSTYDLMAQALVNNDTQTMTQLAPKVLQLIASAYEADKESRLHPSLQEQASQLLMKVGLNLTAVFVNPGEIFMIYHSPDARNLINQSYSEYQVAQQLYDSKDYAGALQHAQKAQDLYKHAQLVEDQYRQQQSTTTANRTVAASSVVTANRTTTAPTPRPIENPLLFSAGALGITIVLVAIILRRRKSISQKREPPPSAAISDSSGIS